MDIAVLTLPKEKAEQAADTLVGLGIHAIWNFAHLDLDLPDDVVVENVHLSDSLMQLSYNIVKNRREQQNRGMRKRSLITGSFFLTGNRRRAPAAAGKRREREYAVYFKQRADETV